MREAKERERELKYKLENKIKLEKTFPLSRSIKSYSIPLFSTCLPYLKHVHQ